ncbi:MAG: class I SAM-dependent methyltransferase, partial [Pseudomonadota bacterium]
LADGDGRNGSWLAGRDFRVTSVDISPAAAALGRERDRRAGAFVERVIADLATWQPTEASAQLVTLQFLQGPWALRRAALLAASRALAPGGWLLVEGFAARDGVAPAEASLGPKRDTHRWRAREIEETLSDLEPHATDIATRDLHDGPRHSGIGRVLTVLRRRPAGSAPSG